jgi:hypothetical protein
VFRHCQAEQAKQLWSLIVQYDECGRNISASEKAQKGAIHESYVLKPSGSADSYNKENRVSKALTYKQILAGDPAINQSELTKYVIEADDPALVQRLWLDENMQFMKQMELAQKQGAIQGAMQASLMQASPPMPPQGAPQGALPPGGDPSQQMMLPPGGDPMAGGMPPAMPPQVGPDGMPLPPVDPSMMGGGMPMVGPGGAMIPGPNGQSIIIQLPPLQLDPNSAAQVFQQMAASLPAPVVQNNVEPTPIQNIVQPSQVVVQPAPAPVVPPAQSQHNIVVEQPAEVDIKLIKDKHGNTTGAKVSKK